MDYTPKPVRNAILREWMKKIEGAGYADLLVELMDGRNFTKSTCRLKRAAVQRNLGWTPTQMHRALHEIRMLIGVDADLFKYGDNGKC